MTSFDLLLDDHKLLYDAYKKLISSRAQAAISMVQWAQNEENFALKDVVNKVGELDLLWTKILQTFTRKLLEQRRVLRQVGEEERMVHHLRQKVALCTHRVNKLQKQSAHARGKRESGKLGQLLSALTVALSEEEEVKKQLQAAVLRMEILKASLVRDALLLVADAGLKLTAHSKVIFNSQQKLAKLIPVIPSQISTTANYTGPDLTARIVEETALEVDIPRTSLEDYCQHRTFRPATFKSYVPVTPTRFTAGPPPAFDPPPQPTDETYTQPNLPIDYNALSGEGVTKKFAALQRENKLAHVEVGEREYFELMEEYRPYASIPQRTKSAKNLPSNSVAYDASSLQYALSAPSIPDFVTEASDSELYIRIQSHTDVSSSEPEMSEVYDTFYDANAVVSDLNETEDKPDLPAGAVRQQRYLNALQSLQSTANQILRPADRKIFTQINRLNRFKFLTISRSEPNLHKKSGSSKASVL